MSSAVKLAVSRSAGSASGSRPRVVTIRRTIDPTVRQRFTPSVSPSPVQVTGSDGIDPSRIHAPVAVMHESHEPAVVEPARKVRRSVYAVPTAPSDSPPSATLATE
ncbi:MAG: hypothetical protein BWY94_02515 [Actinobacteria bacterium ADurb.BinA094]|nr:MAG: hypothetical protein BWY94_02515 [Actinobacteria bacterium ADurb.BinA094]